METLTQQQAQQIKQEARRIGATATNDLAQQVLAFWREHRPQMTAELERLGILEEFVIVQQEKRDDLMIKLIQREGMIPSEAALVAGEHLMMEPEQEDEDETQNQEQVETEPLFQPDQTTT
jgi:hypothetical protein